MKPLELNAVTTGDSFVCHEHGTFSRRAVHHIQSEMHGAAVPIVRRDCDDVVVGRYGAVEQYTDLAQGVVDDQR